MADNPFLNLPQQNPFMVMAAVEQRAQEIMPPQPCGDPLCKRSHRPGLTGAESHYSEDVSERMKQLQAEGRAGAHFAHMGGRKTKRHARASELIAESAAEDAEKIVAVFRDGIDESEPMAIRLRAAEGYLKAEGEAHDRMLKDEQAEYANMDRERLVQVVLEQLGSLRNAAGVLDGTIDVEGEEIDG